MNVCESERESCFVLIATLAQEEHMYFVSGLYKQTLQITILLIDFKQVDFDPFECQATCNPPFNHKIKGDRNYPISDLI